MKIIGDITLIEASTAGNPDKTFTGQTIEIDVVPPTTRQGVDGHLSVGNHPAKIEWYGGTTTDLTGITHVKIVHNGGVLIDGALNTHYRRPKAISGGVSFDVLAE